MRPARFALRILQRRSFRPFSSSVPKISDQELALVHSTAEFEAFRRSVVDLRPNEKPLRELLRITEHAPETTKAYVRRHLAHCSYLQGKDSDLFENELNLHEYGESF